MHLAIAPDKAEKTNQAALQKDEGHPNILLVDDEPAVTEILSAMLKLLGYRVTAVHSARAALTLFSEQPESYDLVITDMAMPAMNGEELSRRLIRLRADIPIILCSGYSDLISEEKRLFSGIKGILSKPFTMGELSQKIQDTLTLFGS